MSADQPSSFRDRLARIPVSYLGWVFLAGGLLFWAGGAYKSITGLDHDRRLEEKGRVVEGTILEKSAGRKSTGRSSETVYRVEFRFAPSRGDEVTDKVEVDKEVWDRLQVAGPISVTYLPGEPEIHRAEGQDPEFTLWNLLFPIFGGALFLFVGRLLLAGNPEPGSGSESKD